MVICFICRYAVDIKAFRNHLKFKHSNRTIATYECCEDDCRRSFQIYSSFKRHLEKCHVSKEQCLQTSNIVENNDFNSHELPPSDNVLNQSNVNIPSCSVSSELSYSLQQTSSIDNVISTFIASLYGNTLLPRNVIQSIVNNLSDCLTSLVPVIEQSVNKVLVEHSISSTGILKNLTNEVQTAVTSSLNNFLTERKRLNYFFEKGSYIKPHPVCIGQRLTAVKSQGITRLQPVDCHEQFIPLRETLKKFLSLNNVLSEMLQYIESLNLKQEKENFIQGTYWKERMNHHDDRTVIPLFMYFDDYETGNVLGSHAGVHKLGAVYVSIPCLPPWRSSALSNIFLVLLFHSSDRISFGNHIIFRPVINELNYLSEIGISIDIPTYKGNIYFELGLILGDNLGLHSMLGLVESFSANYSCRVCKVTKTDLKKQCFEDETQLRNNDMYIADLALGNATLTGVKERCVFLDVKYFDMFQQVGVDIMHDVLEGVAKYLLSFMLLEYTRRLNLFSLSVLNDKMSSMDFGPDSKNRPCSIEKDHLIRGTLRLSSGEMLTLLRFLGIMIGDFVPREDFIWILYVKLRKILDIILSAKITVGTEDLLQVLIGEFNELYIKITKDSLKPKFHNMIHYHSALVKYGPISSLWSMRFEGKHRHSKMAAKASCNRVNPTLTLAMRHQLQLNEIFHRGSLSDVLKVEPKKKVSQSATKIVQSKLHLDSSKSLISVNWAMYSSVRYDIGCILVHSVNDDEYLYNFLIVNQIYLYDVNQLIFSGTLLDTVEFDDHYYAYHVKTPDQVVYCTVFYESLLSPIPNAKSVSLYGKQYIVLRSPL
ncbi:uncharacterized protein LOC133528103 isoform X1 [Cydia pomonella]|uniref:uncharacterized protein LOC133528103 isoform X1 n=1 Tax=Cydia pomonella TaxID=82600 RepID=UPI002ADE7CF4|nr:uncharacterized protein LOC133528103 isoform X1 [Cydia pomonella]XP_061721310.1 uncharacterized protein LOC133528103 isoform X1 [Cydia pomonella]XP_061721311.1 uncharacterized protein LOC133528103 isoform X1 [Cydia pomonella]XP_061721312.1 uncharacterized protein LOC133528103 isoform X1 [Cydia pomonella]